MFKTINGGILPKRFSKYSAGFDVYSNEDVVIGAGETKRIGLGITIDSRLIYGNTLIINEASALLLNCHYLELHIRSSLRVKGLTSLGTGVIDMDFCYPNEIKMVVHNPHQYSEEDYWVNLDESNSCGLPIPRPIKPDYTIKKGDKIGQLILKRHESYLLPQSWQEVQGKRQEI